MKKIILSLVVLVVVAVSCYFAGYKRGVGRIPQSAQRFRIGFGLRLYDLLESGDTNSAMQDIRFVLWSDTELYERLYGVPPTTNYFYKRFSDAKAITASVPEELRKRAMTTPTVNQMVTNIFGSNTIKSITWN